MGYAEDVVRERIKKERAAQEWTQQQLADRVNKHGYEWRWSTVAKIEAGERGVQLGEASALADVFGISLEMLSGRRARPRGDEVYVMRRLNQTVQATEVACQRGVSELRDAAAELSGVPGFARITAEIEEAADAVAAAEKALAAIGNNFAGGAATRAATRAALQAMLDEVEDEKNDNA